VSKHREKAAEIVRAIHNDEKKAVEMIAQLLESLESVKPAKPPKG
jgi:hypothetical protein